MDGDAAQGSRHNRAASSPQPRQQEQPAHLREAATAAHLAALLVGVVHDHREMAARAAALAHDLDTLREYLRTIMAHAPVILFAFDRHGVVTLAEGPGIRRLGFVPEQVVGQSIFDLLPATHPAQQQARRALAGETFTEIGQEAGRVLETRYVPVRDENGAVTGATGVAVDITERTAMEEALRASEARFRALTEHATELVTILDPAATIRYASGSYQRTLGYAPDDLLRTGAFDLVHPDDVAQARDTFAQLLTRPDATATITARVRHADGSWRIMELVGKNRLHDPAVEGIIVTGRDVTERAQAEEALRHQALHDTLTGLPNRTLLRDRLEQAIRVVQRDGRSLALLLLGLDRFKEVNDAFGHQRGDLLLRQVAERLRTTLRATDTVARLGGDEFAILLPDDGRDGSMVAVGKIDGALATPFPLDDHRVHIAASIGIALCPAHGTDAETLLRRAGIAMDVAKRGGEDYAVYAPDQDAYIPERLSLTEELRQAIAQDQLVLYYQPKVDLAARRVERVECLVRWQHPRRGLVSPDTFIPLAEAIGLIRPLTLWVLAEALRQCRAWRQAGLDLGMNVNLSAADLHDPGLVDTVARLLAEHEVSPAALRLELTESALIADMARTEAILSRLSELGVRIAIDDFGTGYSSLSYLKHLPAAELKIDKSFVQHMAQNETDATIVASTVGLGHSLGLRVVAEGVEDGGTLERLAAMGCDAVQGYYVSRPLPAAELEQWLRLRHAPPT